MDRLVKTFLVSVATALAILSGGCGGGGPCEQICSVKYACVNGGQSISGSGAGSIVSGCASECERRGVRTSCNEARSVCESQGFQFPIDCSKY